MAQAQAQGEGEGESGFGDTRVVDRYGIDVFDYAIQGRHGNSGGSVFTGMGLWLADVLFWFAVVIVVALVWLLNFALDFGVAELMLSPVEQLIGVYETRFVGTIAGGGWGLVPLALMICVFWFGLAALRGRVGKGFGEITMSFVLAVLLGAILANPGATLLGDTGLVGRAKDIGTDVAVTAVQVPDRDPPPCVQQLPLDGESLVDGCFVDEFGDGAPPTRDDPQYLRWIMQMWLVDMYVRRPHQQMTYGQRLDCPLVLTVRGTGTDPDPDLGGGAGVCDGPYEQGGDHPCVDIYNQILRSTPETAPQAPGANPDSYMYDMMHPDEPVPGCTDGAPLADYLAGGTGERVVVGLLLLVTLLVVAAFLLVGVLIPIIVGQLMVAVLAVALVFVLPVALLGGGGRRVLWRWFGLLLAAAFMIIMALVGLALMLITTDLLLQGHQRYFFVNLLMTGVASVLFLILQRKLLRGGLLAGTAVGGALNTMRIGGGGGVDGRMPIDPWRRMAGAGYAPLDRWQRNRATRREVYTQNRYAQQWRDTQANGSVWRRVAHKTGKVILGGTTGPVILTWLGGRWAKEHWARRREHSGERPGRAENTPRWRRRTTTTTGTEHPTPTPPPKPEPAPGREWERDRGDTARNQLSRHLPPGRSHPPAGTPPPRSRWRRNT